MDDKLQKLTDQFARLSLGVRAWPEPKNSRLQTTSAELTTFSNDQKKVTISCATTRNDGADKGLSKQQHLFGGTSKKIFEVNIKRISHNS
ncbi:hypothetical protein niasHT_005816 [Heterodera trifolii]|uniref:Uncharacterized protein n=1 Tax=Heterodera trifolii TaxID=157864 RepID=A0ABD2LR42_9BILA